MPRRSNDFQRIVYLIQEHLVQGGTVTESAMLVDSSTGREREVDILIAGEILGLSRRVMVGVECRDHKRPQGVEWVEQAHAKREHLPLDVLILASSSGFTKAARIKAQHHNITLWEPTRPDEDASREIVGTLNSLWAKVLTHNPADITLRLTLESPDGSVVETTDHPGPLPDEVVDIHGAALGSLRASIVGGALSSQESRALDSVPTGPLTLRIDIEDFYVLRASDGARIEAFIRLTADSGTLYRLRELHATVPAEMLVAEVPIEHRSLDGKPYSYAHANLRGREVTILVIEPPGQPPHVSLTTRGMRGG
ncbi:restriction endonuclease [Salana multivorans]